MHAVVTLQSVALRQVTGIAANCGRPSTARYRGQSSSSARLAAAKALVRRHLRGRRRGLRAQKSDARGETDGDRTNRRMRPRGDSPPAPVVDMSAYGVDPPVVMMGLLKVHPQIRITIKGTVRP